MRHFSIAIVLVLALILACSLPLPARYATQTPAPGNAEPSTTPEIPTAAPSPSPTPSAEAAVSETPTEAFSNFPNGTILVDKRTQIGPPEYILEISNTSSTQDAIVLLVDASGKPLYGCYMQANGRTTLQKVPQGEYELYFATGLNWDTSSNTFTQGASYAKSAKRIRFTQTYIYHSNLLRTWTASLILPDQIYSINKDTPIDPYARGFVDGSASTKVELVQLPPEDFPTLEILTP